MPLPEHGIPVVLRKVDESMVGKKLRLVGRMLWYEAALGLIALKDGDHAVLVDVSLCINARSGSWVREYLCQLVVLGHLEECEDALPIPTAPGRSPGPVINVHLVLRAVLAVPDNTLDIAAYNAFLEEGEL